jgi:hypothetical protein
MEKTKWTYVLLLLEKCHFPTTSFDLWMSKDAPMDEYGLKNNIITYVKHEGSNLNTMTNVVKFVVKCETLGLEESL